MRTGHALFHPFRCNLCCLCVYIPKYYTYTRPLREKYLLFRALWSFYRLDSRDNKAPSVFSVSFLGRNDLRFIGSFCG